MGQIIGIDLGTTNSCVAVMDASGRARVLSNSTGYALTPSIVGFGADGKRSVGQLAVRQQVTNPRCTIYASKRLIGRTWDSKEVRHAVDHYLYKLVEGPNGSVRIDIRGRSVAIPEVSAILLQELRAQAEESLGDVVDKAVITVPAYFNENQRQAVRDAGRIAGLDVLRILSEPTAAAFAYSFGTQKTETVAIFDLGGGTFDISIVRIDPVQGIDVLATTGDSYLGGEDFDQMIVDWMLNSLNAAQQSAARANPLALTRMRQSAQKAKNDLSELESVEIQIPFLLPGSDGVNFEAKLTRTQLEEMTRILVQKTIRICARALLGAKRTSRDIDGVVLVGGMTRMPLVQREVSRFFGKQPKREVHPDEAVALGAAIFAATLDVERSGRMLQDVTAQPLGILTAGGRMDILIDANEKLPVRRSSIFRTQRDHQTTLRFMVFQGEAELAKDNEFLCEFSLTELRDGLAGQIEIEVTFELDDDGGFNVNAMDTATRAEVVVEVTGDSGMSSDEVEGLMESSAQFLAERRSGEAFERVRQGISIVLEDLDRMIPDAERRVQGREKAEEAMKRARSTVETVRAKIVGADAETLSHGLSTLEKLRLLMRRVLDEK